MILFDCRYSRSKWLNFDPDSIVPLEVYSHALKGNRNFIHISFSAMDSVSDFDVNQFLCDLPWVTSISPERFATVPIHRDILFIESNDLNTFAKEIKLDPSTYIFTDVRFFDWYSGKLYNNARILISFVAPTSGKTLILRVKHSGKQDPPLEVALGSNKIQLIPVGRLS